MQHDQRAQCFSPQPLAEHPHPLEATIPSTSALVLDAAPSPSLRAELIEAAERGDGEVVAPQALIKAIQALVWPSGPQGIRALQEVPHPASDGSAGEELPH